MAQHQKNQRRKLFIDWDVQFHLLKQCMIHWTVFMLGAFVVLFLCHVLESSVNESSESLLMGMWNRYSLVFYVMVAMLPIFLRDLLKLSHRFAGPMVKLRKSMRAVAQGETIEPIQFREKDFWQDIAAEFNAILARLDAVSAESSPLQSGEQQDEVEDVSSNPASELVQTESAH